MWANLQFTADLVTFTEEILNRKLYFLYIESRYGYWYLFAKWNAWNEVVFLNNQQQKTFLQRKNVIEQEYNNPFGVNPIEKEGLINISAEIAFDNEIVEDIIDFVEKGNELMNQFLIERICQNLIPF